MRCSAEWPHSLIRFSVFCPNQAFWCDGFLTLLLSWALYIQPSTSDESLYTYQDLRNSIFDLLKALLPFIAPGVYQPSFSEVIQSRVKVL